VSFARTISRHAMRAGAVVALACVLVGSPASAQSGWRTRGPWVGAGLGAASGRITCDACVDAPRSVGPAAQMAFGYTFSSRLQLAAEVGGWVHSSEQFQDRLGSVSASLYVFPLAHPGIFVAGGLGLARARSLLHRSDATEQTSVSGLGLHAGIGVDLPVSRQVSLVPSASLLRGNPAELEVNGFATGQQARHSYAQVGVNLVWHIEHRW
jgi:hypothetical protein